MGLSKARNITLAISGATLCSNFIYSLLFHQLPDDPYYLADSFGWYLHFANIVSVFGFIGALRQHAISIAIFSNFLIIDSIVCSIPRFLVLRLLQQESSSVCSSASTTRLIFPHQSSQFLSFPVSGPSNLPSSLSPPPLVFSSDWTGADAGWTPSGCFRIVHLSQLTLVAALVAATLLQFVGALYAKGYAKGLWIREEAKLVEDMVRRRSLGEKNELPVIFEDILHENKVIVVVDKRWL